MVGYAIAFVFGLAAGITLCSLLAKVPGEDDGLD
jgi:hypothetical protein